MADPYDSFSQPFSGSSGATVSADPYDKFSATPSSVGNNEAAKAAVEGAGYGAIKGAGALAGAALGAKGGALAGATLGPVGAAVGGVVGGLVGTVAGSEGPGEMATQALGLRAPQEMEPRLRPYGYFGESIGGSATVVGSVYSLASTGIRFMDEGIGKFANMVLDTARRRPAAFAAAEALPSTAAAAAAGTAEAVAPGQTEVRMGAEMVGGFFSGQLTVAVAKRGFQEIRRLSEGLTPGGAERGALRMIREVFERTGGDVSAIAEVYRTAGIIPTGQLTPAQKTGSVELTAIEDYVASLDKDFGARVDTRFRDALDVIRGNIATLMNTGDPRDLEAAAAMQRGFFESLVQERAQKAAMDAQKVANKIKPGDGVTMASESVRMNDAVQEGIAASRKHEALIWSEWLRIDGQQSATATNLESTFKHHQDKLDTWANTLPNEVRQFLKNLEGEGTQKMVLDSRTGLLTMKDVPGSAEATSAEKLWNQRSQILAEMRKAQSGASPDHNRARILSDLAEAITKDLESALTPEGRVAYDNARAFTKEFYDVYQRSFVGRTQSSGSYGDMMAPELIGRRVFAGPDEGVLIKLDELEEATRFVQRNGLGGDTAVATMLDAQEKIARIVATNVIDPSTGRVVPEKVDRLLNNTSNKTLFNRFPEIKADLLAAKRGEDGAREVERIGQGQIKTLDARILTRILRKDPVPIAIEVLASPNMNVDLQKMLNAAKPVKSRSGGWIVTEEQAVMAKRGAAASVFEAAVRMSMDKNGVLNPQAFRALIESSPVPGQKSALQVLQENGAVDPAQAKNIKRLFTEMESLISTTRNQRTVTVTPDLPEAAGAVLARMMGSGVAGNMARTAGSQTPSLVVHGAGAKFFEHIYSKLGVTTASRFLSEALMDPAKMNVLLTKASTQTPVERAATNRRIYAWLVQSGLGLTEEVGAAVDRELVQPYTQPTTAPQLFTQPR